jgi:hypothetical protein
MKEILDEFFNHLVELERKYGNFQARSIFYELRGTNMEKYKDTIFDFYAYLFNHDIIRYGTDFNNYEPFTKFTKFGQGLINNEGRKIAMFENFLEIHGYQQMYIA